MEKLDRERLKFITSKTHRSEGQTQELYTLCDFDFEKLKKYEYNSKNNFLNYCASTKDEVLNILNMQPKKEYWTFENGWNRL